MKIRKLALLVALAWPSLVSAQAEMRRLVTCDQLELDLRSAAVGADLNGVRSFHRGAVTLFLIDRFEPACCAYGIAVVMPEQVEEGPGDLQCWAVWGYAGADVRGARARYDPREGLTLTIPVRDYVPETGGSVPMRPLRLRIDVGRGTIVDLDARGSPGR